MGNVICAVLWRLLPSWQNKGPVLEVLFLATSPQLRERQWALELEQELEASAVLMGCSAICVAAVPVQGMNFWTNRCGFEVVVPLKPELIKKSEDVSAGVTTEDLTVKLLKSAEDTTNSKKNSLISLSMS